MKRPTGRSRAGTRRAAGLATLALASLLAAGCATAQAPRSAATDGCAARARFLPVDFGPDGELADARQVDALLHQIVGGSVEEVFFLIHGWNRTPHAQEDEYRDFLCDVSASALPGRGDRPARVLLVCLFWHATSGVPLPEVWLLLPVTYPLVREQADAFARGGFGKLLGAIGDRLLPTAAEPSSAGGSGARRVALHFVGHSLGARVLVKGLAAFVSDAPRDAVRLFAGADGVHVVLLNSTVSADALESAPAPRAASDQLSRAPAPRWDAIRSLVFLNVFLPGDWLSRYLYAAGSVLTRDRVTCGLGACALNGYPVLSVREDGSFEDAAGLRARTPFVNVDVSRFMSGHSNNYNARVAGLVGRTIRLGRALLLASRATDESDGGDQACALERLDAAIELMPDLAWAREARAGLLIAQGGSPQGSPPPCRGRGAE